MPISIRYITAKFAGRHVGPSYDMSVSEGYTACGRTGAWTPAAHEPAGAWESDLAIHCAAETGYRMSRATERIACNVAGCITDGSARNLAPTFAGRELYERSGCSKTESSAA